MVRSILGGLFLFFFCFSFSVQAENTYIYRQKINWVKLDKADPKDVPLGSLKHPYTSVSTEEMEAMLLSIKIAKRYALKKTVESVDVFNSWEARRYAPFLVEGLAKVDPDHVINFALIHKRPAFILQNDYITMGNVWADSEGIHFQFTKLFAKISGDYEASAHTDKTLRKVKSQRLALEAGPGQKLSYYSAMEVIMDPAHNFISEAQVELARRQAEEESLLQGKAAKKKKGKAARELVTEEEKQEAADAGEASGSQDVAGRLRELEKLKTDKLISEQEYQNLRKKIMQEI